jgi:hypothetical protein
LKLSEPENPSGWSAVATIMLVEIIFHCFFECSERVHQSIWQPKYRHIMVVLAVINHAGK